MNEKYYFLFFDFPFLFLVFIFRKNSLHSGCSLVPDFLHSKCYPWIGLLHWLQRGATFYKKQS